MQSDFVLGVCENLYKSWFLLQAICLTLVPKILMEEAMFHTLLKNVTEKKTDGG
jgi:hypothetical protein